MERGHILLQCLTLLLSYMDVQRNVTTFKLKENENNLRLLSELVKEKRTTSKSWKGKLERSGRRPDVMYQMKYFRFLNNFFFSANLTLQTSSRKRNINSVEMKCFPLTCVANTNAFFLQTYSRIVSLFHA